MSSSPGPAKPRRRWVRWLGAAVLLLLATIGFVAARLWWQHRQHHELREAEVGRAPVVAPRSGPTNVPRPAALPRGTLCLHGSVTDHGAPVADVQVSHPDPERKGFGPCLGVCDAERLTQLLATPRAGLLEPVKSATTGPDGRFLLCGLSEPLPPFLFGEHADGRVASQADGFLQPHPGLDVGLTMRVPTPVSGLVRTPAGAPVKGRLLLYTMPSLLVRDVVSDATGHFSTTLPTGSVIAIVAPEGSSPIQVRDFVSYRQPLILTVPEPFSVTVRALLAGQPVPGAEVVMGRGEPRLTDAKGEATFTVVSEYPERIVVTKGELIGAVQRFSRPASRTHLDVDLVPGIRLTGSVIDEAGASRIGTITGFPGGALETDANGRFTSPLLPRDTLHLGAEVEGCARAEATVETASAKPVLFEVRCAPTVTGMVLDAEGNPIAQAMVSLQGAEFQGIETKADGHFTLHVPQGAYELSVEHPDYRGERRPLTVPAKDVAVVLDAGGSIAGRVVDEAGRPVPSVDVTVIPGVIDELFRTFEGGMRGSTTTADDGTFRVRGLLAGRWILVVSGASLPTSPSEPLVLQPGENKEGVVVTMGGTVDLSGVVLDDERRPVPGVRVKWEPSDEKAALSSVILDVMSGRMEEAVRFLSSDVVTGVDGRFELRNVQVKEVTVSASAAGFVSAEQKTTKGSTVELVLKRYGRGRVVGRVVDEAGHPVTRFDVNGERAANEAGDFDFETELGHAFLHFTAPGFAGKNVELELKEPRKDLGAVTLTRGLALTTTVRQEGGQPLDRARVIAMQGDDVEGCSTNTEGTCTISTLRDEPTKVRVAHTGFLEKSTELAKGSLGAPLEVTLSAAGGRLEGVLFAAPGRPAVARRLTVNVPRDSDFALTDERGHFAFSGLPEGPGCVNFELSGLLGTEWSMPVTLAKTPTPLVLGPSERGGTVVTRSTLPGRVVVLGGAAGPLKAAEVGSGMVSSLCTNKRVPALSYITTGEARLEGLPAGTWSVYLVAVTELDEAKDVAPVIIELGPGDTKRVP